MFERNLKFYRLKKNMTKKELADKVGVTPMAITNYESGKRRPDMSTITKIADVLGVLVSDFLSCRNESLCFVHQSTERDSCLTKIQRELLTESAEEYLSRLFDAVECLGGNPLPSPFVPKACAYGADSETDGMKLRKVIGICGNGPVGDVFSLLEDIGILAFELDVAVDNFSGMYGIVNDYPYIAVNSNLTREEKKIVLLSNLAHIVFASEEDWKDMERKALAAAGAALITKAGLLSELGPRRTSLTRDFAIVSARYGISMELLVKRARKNRIISESLEWEFRRSAEKSGRRETEADVMNGDEKPRLLEKLVLRAVNEGEINIVRGSELLGVTVPEMRKYCGPLIPPESETDRV